jgi:hypothetical protein
MRNSKVLSYISIILLGAFIILSIGSDDFPLEAAFIFPYAIGSIEIFLHHSPFGTPSIYFADFLVKEIYLGFSKLRRAVADTYGRLHGESENKLSRGHNGSFQKVTDIDTFKIVGTYEYGLRHGWHEYFLSDGSLYDRVYYEEGRSAIPQGNDGSTSSIIGIVSQYSSHVLSFEILKHESPWFLFKMNAYGYDPESVEDFMAALQSRIIFHAPWSESGFTDAFRESVEDVRANDTLLIRVYEFIAAIEGLSHLRNFELRLAIFDRYLGNGESTYEILQEHYPEFLGQLLAFISVDALKGFVDDLDERMDNESPIDLSDPGYIQVIDERLVSIVNDMFASFDHLFTLLVLQTMITDMIFTANPVHEALKAAYFPTSVDVEGMDITELPTRVSLEQNYPNPFNPTTNIRYSIAETASVHLSVYDTVGKEVAILVNQVKNPGSYIVSFDASHLSSGVYLYQLRTGDHVETKRLVLVK